MTLAEVITAITGLFGDVPILELAITAGVVVAGVGWLVRAAKKAAR